jgi:hypothetical protein
MRLAASRFPPVTRCYKALGKTVARCDHFRPMRATVSSWDRLNCVPAWYAILVTRAQCQRDLRDKLGRCDGDAMTCTSCGQPLISALERTRGVCASCHVLSRQPGKPRAGDHSVTQPPTNVSPGEILDSTTAPAAPLDDQSPAQDDVPDRDSNSSNASDETGLRR